MANFLGGQTKPAPGDSIFGKTPGTGQTQRRGPWGNMMQDAMMRALLQQNRLNQPPGSQGPQNVPVDTLTALFQHANTPTNPNDFQNFIRTLFQQPTGGGQ